jgi:hypothetical protein
MVDYPHFASIYFLLPLASDEICDQYSKRRMISCVLRKSLCIYPWTYRNNLFYGRNRDNSAMNNARAIIATIWIYFLSNIPSDFEIS